MKIGLAFSDHIRTEKLTSRRRNGESEGKSREYLLVYFIILASLLLAGRLFFLQNINGSYYRLLADKNRTRTHVVLAPRGIIFDRNEKPLVFNIPGFRQTIDKKSTVISREEALQMLALGKGQIEIASLREYPYKESLAHLLGYVGQISHEELEQSSFKTYRPTDWVGKSGVEESYEKTLKGIDGKQLVEVDALGRQVRILGQTDPIPGKDIALTIDLSLQRATATALKDVKKGAAIVATPKGEILALVSRPSFDPNLFTMGDQYKLPEKEIESSLVALLTDETNQPLLNRTISGAYPPGSTFKLITAAAALETGSIDEAFTVEDSGVLRIGAFSFSNWYFTQYGGRDGEVNVVKGIKRSNDIFFYKVAERIGEERLSSEARKFGLGEKLGIDLPSEVSGTVPSDSWKRKVIGEQWYLGDTYHYGIGQGYLLTSPLQVNTWTQVIANGGTLYQPHLLKNEKITHSTSSGFTLKVHPEGQAIKNEKFLSEKTVNLIRQGMIESCNPGGVAWPLFEFSVKNAALKIDGKNILEAPKATTSADFKDYRKIAIACKTGTAQHGGEETLPHAWITLFAPAYDPQIVVTVLSEESGEGSNVAAPIAKKILESWFTKNNE